jgi:antirestriction protein ArdC
MTDSGRSKSEGARGVWLSDCFVNLPITGLDNAFDICQCIEEIAMIGGDEMDIRQNITDMVLAQIEAGTPPWRKAWSSNISLPENALTHARYTGINVLILGMTGYEDNRFLTVKQAATMSLKIRKDELPAAHIVKMVEVDRREASKVRDGEVVSEDKDKMLVMISYPVFNASQLEPGLEPLAKPQREIEPIAAAEAMVNGLKATGLKVVEGTVDASYSARSDTIRIPAMSSFHGTDPADVAANFWGTKLHEAAHATGHPSRLSRLFLDGNMTKEQRAYEELIAEWAAAMGCAICGVKLGEDHVRMHASYLSSWADVLKSDKSAIFRAAAAAQRVCDYLSEHSLAPAMPKPVEIATAAANEPVAQIAPPRRQARPR